MVLSSALKLCTEVEHPAAWDLGQQLWQQTEDEGLTPSAVQQKHDFGLAIGILDLCEFAGMEKNSITYSAYITMLETLSAFWAFGGPTGGVVAKHVLFALRSFRQAYFQWQFLIVLDVA